MTGNDILVCGIDEAGRGALAGPVVACALVLPKHFFDPRVKDSKQLTPDERTNLAKFIKGIAVDLALGLASSKEIERLNILLASLLAMRRAYNKLRVKPKEIIIDGTFCPEGIPHGICIAKADSFIPVVSAASIIAKVERDKIMTKLSKKFPQYTFNKHKGYPTKMHLFELKVHGVTPIHRKTFKPVSKTILSGE